MSHLFGLKQRFAVEYELLSPQSLRDLSRSGPIEETEQMYWLFGHVCVWAAGSRVGDYQSPTALTVALATLNGQLLRHRGSRFDDYYRFIALPDLDVFERWSAYLLEDQQDGRYLWRDPEGSVKEARLNAGEVDSVFESFITDLEQRTGQRRAV